MQTKFTGRADVHGGTLAHRFHATEDFDGVGGVVSVGRFAVLIFRVKALRVGEFGLQFFGGHSAPWRKPDRLSGGRFRDCSGELQLIEFSAI